MDLLIDFITDDEKHFDNFLSKYKKNQKKLQIIFKKFLKYSNKINILKIISTHLETVNFGNSHTGENINPLIYASRHSKWDIIRFLIEETDVDVNYLSENDTTAIMYAAEISAFSIVEYLLENGAFINI